MDAQTFGIESLASDLVSGRPDLAERVRYILAEFRDERCSPAAAWQALNGVAPEWAPNNQVSA